MEPVRCISLLQRLHQRRRTFALPMLGLIGFWAVAALFYCSPSDMAAKSVNMHAAAAGGTATHSASADAVLCGDCTVGSEARSLEVTALIVTASKLWMAFAFVITAVLLSRSFAKTIPIPPRPLLPKRPRALKFYALRI